MSDRARGGSRARLAGRRRRTWEVLGGGHHEPQRQGDAPGRRRSCSASPGKETGLLGIDRAVEHAATLAAAAVGRRPGRRPLRRAGGLARDASSSRARSRRRSGCASPSSSRASPPRCARSTTAPPIPGPLRDARGRRGVPRHGARARRDAARRVRRARTSARARIAARRAGASAAAVPQRPAQRELHRRRRAAADRRLGVRGHGRPVLRPRELLDQPRARRATGARTLLARLRRRGATRPISPRST